MSGAVNNDIAVIGMAGRFPGARDIGELWHNLVAGVETISFFSDDELRAAGVPESDISDPNYVKASPMTHGAEEFDGAYFGMSMREAEVLDPQHRVFLEVCDGALQHGGYDNLSYPERIGVYGGVGFNVYLSEHVNFHPDVVRTVGKLATNYSNSPDYTCTTVAYRLGLRGPAFTCLSACSTSLVAVHLACQALINGDCEMALAGGVEEFLPRISGYFYTEGGIDSPDGHCRTFDAKARGTVFGSGAGAVLLKPLATALADGDNVLAVIRGSAINNDGSEKGAFTAPSVEGQFHAVSHALKMSGVDPATITYVEAHGTSTFVGDPIEVAALSKAYRVHTDRRQYCGIGSIKTNVGHLGAAAGVTGLIKTVMAMRHRVLPPHLNFDEPNPQIDFAGSPFYVNTELTPWKSDAGPLRAGVSSFGVGGTNAHLVLEEAPEVAPSSPPSRSHQLIVLSARTPTALTASATGLAEHLRQHPDELADASYTLAVGRTRRQVRGFLVAGNPEEAADRLSAGVPLPSPAVIPPREGGREIAFLFPGQGAQYVQMGRDLYQDEPVFRAELDACADVLAAHAGWDLRELLYPGDSAEGDGAEAAAQRLTQTAVTQPALFAIEYALARLLEHWGVRPDIMAGHSIGEYVAACLAGVFRRDDALRLVATRGALMQDLPTGTMIAVPLSEELLTPMLTDEVDLAAINAPDLCVVSGPDEAVAALRDVLSVQGIEAQPLHTSHAFHSGMMEPILEQFTAAVAAVQRQAPTIPVVSNLTGQPLTAEQATDPGYWAQHLRHAVRFGDAVRLLTAGGKRVLLEVGPGQTLTSLARRQLERDQHGLAVSTMRHPKQRQPDVAVLLGAVGQVWQAGGEVKIEELWAGERRLRRALPPVPYEPVRCWLEPGEDGQSGADGKSTEATETGPYYVPTWRETAPLPVPEVDTSASWLVFLPAAGADGGGEVLEQLVDKLRAAGAPVIAVRPGEEHQVGDGATMVVRAREAGDYGAVMAEALRGDPSRLKVVHGWLLGDLPGETTRQRARAGLDLGFFSILHAVQALSRHASAPPLDLFLLTSQAQDVTGAERIEPVRAGVDGFVRLVPKEISNATCRSVDVVCDDPDLVAGHLFREVCGTDTTGQVAYRRRKRWAWSYQEYEPFEAGEADRLLPDRGVYLITGGLGGIGLVMAKELASRHSARIALLGRNSLPPREQWDGYLAEHDPEEDQTAQRITAVREVEQAGGEVLVFGADVTDVEQLRAVRGQIEQSFGPVNAVLHAAGVTGGGMLETRSFADAEDVMAAKVFGTLALEEVFGDTIDLLVLYSSFTVFAGDFGLGDYCSANAIMDSFAHARGDSRTHVVSINWPIWHKLGMAFNIDAPDLLMDFERGDRYRPVKHPLLDSQQVRAGSETVTFIKELSTADWVTNEHRLEDEPTVPGTGLVEMVRAAYQEVSGQESAELRDVVFMRPLSFSTRRTVQVTLTPAGGGMYDVLIRDADGGDGTPEEFTRARVGPAPADVAPVHDLAAWRAKCGTEGAPEGKSEAGMISLGPRWQTIRRHWRSDTDDAGLFDELVEIELSEEHLPDLDQFVLHPSSLDNATALGQTVVASQTRHLPFGYDRIVVRRRLPARLYSYIQHHDDTLGSLIRVDCTLVDDDGAELVAVKGFTMFEYADRSMQMPEQAAAGETATEATPAAAETGGDPGYTVARQLERALLRGAELAFGIAPEDGYPMLRTLLDAGTRPQVIVCPDSFAKRIRMANEVTREALREQLTAAPTQASSVAPRSLPTPYVEPETDVQRVLAGMWSYTLAVEPIGIDDDFFDLNGNSLIAVQLVARIREQFQVDLAVATLFESRTIRALAEVVDGLIVASLADLSDEEAAQRLARITAQD